MDKHIEEIKKDYSIEKGFFDKIYLTVEETKVIEGMKHKERNIYLKQNEIALDDDNLSKNCGKYYKRNYWDISNDEILFLINLDNNILLNKINWKSMKNRITVTIDKNLVSWIDKKIKDKTFANRSHALEFLIKRRMDIDK